MKTSYFTKIENKYVFNFSLIIWHTLIILAFLSIVISSLVFLWGIVPAGRKKVEKLPYPEKKEYPSPVTVSIEDLRIKRVDNAKIPSMEEILIDTKPKNITEREDLTGKKEYDLIIDTLKILIPPTKYIREWEGEGYYEYPLGKNYWDYHQKEIYRKWVVKKAGLLDKLNSSYNKANAKNFLHKRELLKGYVQILVLIPENLRINALDEMMSYVSENVQTNNNNLSAISAIVKKVDVKEMGNISIIGLLSNFCNDKPSHGLLFINYVSSIIDKFSQSQHFEVIKQIRNGYYLYFDQDINILKDATDLYIPLLAKLGIKEQAIMLSNYYNVFVKKNNARNNQIRQIEFDYQSKIEEIDNNYYADKQAAQLIYQEKKFLKEKVRLRSLMGIGIGIIMIVLIGTFLAFLSIQRSVRKMEEEISGARNH